MLQPPEIDAHSAAELKGLVLKLLQEVAELRRTVVAQRDEIARLKGGPGRPNIKPSGMDKATEPQPAEKHGGGRRRDGTRTKLTIHEAHGLLTDTVIVSDDAGLPGLDPGIN